MLLFIISSLVFDFGGGPSKGEYSAFVGGSIWTAAGSFPNGIKGESINSWTQSGVDPGVFRYLRCHGQRRFFVLGHGAGWPGGNGNRRSGQDDAFGCQEDLPVCHSETIPVHASSS